MLNDAKDYRRFEAAKTHNAPQPPNITPPSPSYLKRGSKEGALPGGTEEGHLALPPLRVRGGEGELQSNGFLIILARIGDADTLTLCNSDTFPRKEDLMVVEKMVCDRCKNDVKAGGYRVSYDMQDRMVMISVTLLDDEPCTPVDNWGEHYCGKEHLMLALNEVIDIKKGFIHNAPSDPPLKVRGGRGSYEGKGTDGFQPLNPERIREIASPSARNDKPHACHCEEWSDEAISERGKTT
jgi:hypothetical protein